MLSSSEALAIALGFVDPGPVMQQNIMVMMGQAEEEGQAEESKEQQGVCGMTYPQTNFLQLGPLKTVPPSRERVQRRTKQ